MGNDGFDGLKWRPLRGVQSDRLTEARLQAHHAVQWLARAARGYISPQLDDSHTSLRWDNDLDGFVTHPFSDGTRLGLQISTLTLAWRSDDIPSLAQSFSLNGQTDAQARYWIGQQTSARGLDAHSLDMPSPYEIPNHPVADGAPYTAVGLADALAELVTWYADAELMLGHVERHMIAHNLAASAVCCWPHHFDLATLTALPKQSGDTGYIGTGFSPGDEYYAEPYFYVSVYPDPDPAILPVLPAMGHWHTHEFTAGVMPAQKILAAKDAAANTGEFLQGAIAFALKVLN